MADVDDSPATSAVRGPDLPESLAPYGIDGAEIVVADTTVDERPGRDSLGNAGRVRSLQETGEVSVCWPRSRIVRHLEGAGLVSLGDARGQNELHRAPAELAPEDVDPFLLEDSVRVVVSGRDFPGQQRALLEAKAEALRHELHDAATSPDRRAQAAMMLHAMEAGLRATVEMRAVRRRFSPVVHVGSRRERLGTVVPLRPGWRLLYRVTSLDPETGLAVAPEGDEDDGLMVFHLVAIGEDELVVLYTGGVHGLRHLANLDDSRTHDAWFVNRERTRTDATAPWIGRRVYAELTSQGSSRLVVHCRRDAEPLTLERTGEGTVTLPVAGDDVEVPVVRAKTSRGDHLTILADAESPLVLRLHEVGAELVRTIDAVLPPLPEL